MYQRAVALIELVADSVGRFPPGRQYLADQLLRGSLSIALNIAEGAGEFSSRDKARFYRISLRSATECAALLDVARRLQIVDASAAEKGRALLLEIVAMLTGLVKSLERRPKK